MSFIKIISNENNQDLKEKSVESHSGQNLWTQKQKQIKNRPKVHFYLSFSFVKGVASTVKNTGKSPAQLEAEFYEKKKLKK